MSVELARVQQSSVPEPVAPPDNMSIEEWKEHVKEQFPVFREGVRVEIPGELAERIEFLKWASDYYTDQLEMAKIQVRQALGDGQIAVSRGRPVAKRLRFWKKTFTVEGHFEDQLRPTRTKA